MRPPLVVAVVTLVAAISSQTQAQQLQGVPRLDPQSRVRVWATSPVMTDQHATVIGVSADTLHLFIGEQMEGVPLAAVTRLEVRTRARGGHGWTGFFAGALVGGIIGYTSFRRSAAICDFKCDLRPLNAAFAGLLGGATGAMLGSVLPPEKWERVR